VSIETYVPMDPQQERALDRIRTNLDGSFFLFGDYARGKTHLATAQYQSLVTADQSCLFRSMGELISELRRSEIDEDYFSVLRQRVRYAERLHLFIDDIDKFKGTDFKTEVLFDLFDTLYRRKLALTVTSNHSLSELANSDNINPAIVRRIDDMCQAVEV